jgi:hypothetical protein
MTAQRPGDWGRDHWRSCSSRSGGEQLESIRELDVRLVALTFLAEPGGVIQERIHLLARDLVDDGFLFHLLDLGQQLAAVLGCARRPGGEAKAGSGGSEPGQLDHGHVLSKRRRSDPEQDVWRAEKFTRAG